MYSVSIVAMLEESVEKLRADLSMLEYQMKQNKDGMYITHDNYGTLVVYSSMTDKAYVPKTYDDWPVRFIEWNGEELELDIDEPIEG